MISVSAKKVESLPNFLVPISLKLNGVNPKYLKFRLFGIIELKV